MKHHGVPVSLLSTFPTRHDITCKEIADAALRERCVTSQRMVPGYQRVFLACGFRDAE